MRSLAIVTLLFVISLLAGYAYTMLDAKGSEEVVNSTFSSFDFVRNLEHYEIFLFIFMNNSLKSFMAMVLGIAFGIVPVLFVILNGVIIGLVVGVIGVEFGVLKTAMMLVPHGILEIPAVLLSCAYGLEIGYQALRRFRGEDVDLNSVLMAYIKRFVMLPLPMLLIAALVETYITPLVAGL
ncbi:putative membrane protein [Geoglobus ahangari]|uniref:Putative membrane protein n=1 Tax=Geoglobus ahangari TaxID=113653 RepID=A0A0F7DBB3_9EURY|nr:stage II sporulation protein M [Geoglobus ahangari]AKG90791.1 putative membrane protein [Geoglobus ahangari]